MIVVSLVLSIALMLVPVSLQPLGRRFEAHRWRRACTSALLVGAAGLYLTLLALALPQVSELLGARRLAQVCDELLGHLPHRFPAIGWTALALTITGAGVVWHTLRSASDHLTKLAVEPAIGHHTRCGPYELVVLPTAAHIAYSRSGRPGQIVISVGTAAALSTTELEMVIRHEQAHLDRAHERMLKALMVVRRLGSWVPGVGRSVEAARLAIEREADELAAGSSPTRRAALARALSVLALERRSAVVAAMTGCAGVQERLASMRGELAPLGTTQHTALKLLFDLLPGGSLPAIALPLFMLAGPCGGR
jgi:hypothetical protein